MRTKIVFFSVLLSFSTLSFAQETGDEIRTLFDRPNGQSIGGYGVFGIGYTQVDNLDAIHIGARAMVLINHSIGLGVGGQGIISSTRSDQFLNENYEYGGGYGGFYIEPIVGWRNPVHLSFPILIGAGGISYVKHWGDYDENHDYQNYDEDSDAFFVFEPGVELEFNIVKFMRMSVAASYRYTSDIELNYKTVDGAAYSGTSIGPNNMLRGINVGLALKFGKF